MSGVADWYARLPGCLQSPAISAYGMYLRRLRTGGVYRHTLAEFAARDRYTHEQWHRWQSDAVRALLRFAIEQVPYYRELHRAGRYPIEEVRTVDDLAVLPTIGKRELRERPRAFIADGVKPARLISVHTSGTTGTPLHLWVGRDALRKWYAAVEQRMRRWHGLTGRMRHATLGGRLVVRHERRQPPFWRYNAAGRQLYMSIHHLAAHTLDAYLDALKRFRIVYIYGYGSALDALASYARHKERDDVHLAAAISNAEPFFEPWRTGVEKAFGCRTVDTYAASEQTFACFEYGRTMYVSPDVGVFEVVRPDDTCAAPDEPGEVCGTRLLDRSFVLIRYRQGDTAALAPPGTQGDGPFAMPIVRRLEGRTDDVLFTPDGRSIGRLDPVFKNGMRILEAQIAQVGADELEVRVVPDVGYTAADDGAEIERQLLARVGRLMRVRVVCVPGIARGANGKFPFFVRECAIGDGADSIGTGRAESARRSTPE